MNTDEMYQNRKITMFDLKFIHVVHQVFIVLIHDMVYKPL